MLEMEWYMKKNTKHTIHKIENNDPDEISTSKNGVPRQIFATVVASLSILMAGMWIGWPSSAVEKFIKHETDFDVTMDQLSWIVSFMDLGNVASPLLGGYLMNRTGRKPCTVAMGPLYLASWLLAVYVPHPWALYAARLMAGVGKGLAYTVVPVYLAEIAGVHVRGALGGVFCLQLHLGFLVEAAAGPHMSYRALNAASAAVPVAFAALAVWVPESPYYLLMRGRRNRAAECLRWYRGVPRGGPADGGRDDGADDVGAELRRVEANVAHDMRNRAAFRELFASRRDRGALATVVAACACQRAGGVSCILAYSALVLPEPAPLGLGRGAYVTLFAVLLVAVNAAAAALVDRLGRRPLLLFSEAAMAAVTGTFAAYFYARDRLSVDVAAVAWLPYACHAAFAVAFAAGAGFVPVVYLGEMFPQNVRSHCSAVAAVTLALCSFVTNKSFLFVVRRYGFHAMFAAFAAVNVAGAAYTYAYALETKGKTFQEIQEMLARKHAPGDAEAAGPTAAGPTAEATT